MQYNDQRPNSKLLSLREEIDELDRELLLLIGKRIDVVKQIGELKKTDGKPIKDAKREEEKIESLVKKNKHKLVTKEIIKKVWQVLFEIAYKIEE